MVGGRTFLMLVFGCWIISVLVMFFNLEEYHPIHDQKQELIQDFVHQVWPMLNEDNDRILDQLQLRTTHGSGLKSIFMHPTFVATENLPLGQEKFIMEECPVTACSLTKNSADARTADLIISKGGIDQLLKNPKRPKNQITVWYQLESPMNSRPPYSMVNWTATYRRDSTITAPYQKFSPVSDYHNLPRSPNNYAKDKTKKVAWFVSNCHSDNGRLEYAKELANYIDVDIYGACGPFKCSRSNQTKCEELLNRDYKFYLSFESSHCKDYVTEKFYNTGLGNNVIPIAFGASREDYMHVAPTHSYIHTDDFESPQHLADYLHKLDANDTMYNEYFHWKGTETTVNTKFWCRLCAMLHEAHSSGVRSWYSNLRKWWKGDDVCWSRDDGPESQRKAKRQYQSINDTYHIEFPNMNNLHG